MGKNFVEQRHRFLIIFIGLKLNIFASFIRQCVFQNTFLPNLNNSFYFSLWSLVYANKQLSSNEAFVKVVEDSQIGVLKSSRTFHYGYLHPPPMP